ncbi:MAG: hypothetical protein ACYTFW_12905 [Planctomycetota bacterium]|jgi:hypothetical protein
MQDNKQNENNSDKPLRLPKNILRFVDDFFLGGCKITPAQEKAFTEARKCLFEGIKLKRNDPDLVFFQTARELLDFFDLVESDASSITMYQRKKFRTAVAIYKELLIGEWEKRWGVKTLADLDDPVTCVEVAKAVRLDPDNLKRPKKKRKRPRSDNIKRRLEKGNPSLPVVVDGHKSYCEANHAALIWPEFKKYWKKKQLEE